MSEVEVKNMKSVKPFLMPEDIPEFSVTDPSKVEGLPKKYVPRWAHKDKMASNRTGVWVAVDKTHPDFKNVRVSSDSTPNATVITRGDLILCVTHKDTYRQLMQRRKERAGQALINHDKQAKAVLDQVAKEGVGSLKTVLSDSKIENTEEE